MDYQQKKSLTEGGQKQNSKDMKHFNKSLFSHKLNDKQIQMQLTVVEASREIGIGKNTLSRLNRNIGIPDLQTYYLCCKWLDIDMSFFIKP